MFCWLAGWRVSGQAWINKLRVYPICSPATLITTHVLWGTTVIIGPRYHRSKKIPYCKTTHWTVACLLHGSLGADLQNSSFTLVGHCQGLAGSWAWDSIFDSVMIKMGFINAQFDSHGQTNVSWVCLPGLWSLRSGTWYGLCEPVFLCWCGRS